jgi:uncharacterized protein (TIGR02246 family)
MLQDEDAIRALIQLWHERTASGDVPGVLSLMTDDAVFLTAGRPAMTGKAAFEKVLRTALESARIESSANVEEVLVSGDLACARAFLSVRVIPMNGPAGAKRHGPTLSVFVRSREGAWLLKRDANLLSGP